MTDNRKNAYYNYEAMRALVAFFMLLFVVAFSVDVGYLQAKKFEMQGNVNLATMTAVEALPDIAEAKNLAMNIANSQGTPLQEWNIKFDENKRWLDVEIRENYEPMFLKYVGIERVALRVHAFDFKPDI
jgi:hypothetical protein